MEYGEMVGFACVKLIYDKNELMTQIYNINHQLEDLSKYDTDLLTDDMCISLYNKQNTYNMQLEQLCEEVKKIDKKFDTIIKGLLLSFSKTNILEKDLTEQIIYGRI